MKSGVQFSQSGCRIEIFAFYRKITPNTKAKIVAKAH